ncbi:MAG: GNAT family N-acetyltransferase [Dehalococcoidales bacterium]|nr:MAG: GNAT family N-acetyltransferase [Dehalococcoidales bacterium]
MSELSIREITGLDELRNSARVVRNAFKTVALEFNLTRENSPTHPSFMTTGRLREDRNKGVKFFGLFLGDKQIGFVAVEKADASLYYIERLAVLPRYRHRGYGRQLMEFAFEFIRVNGGTKVSIGIINEHTVLKDWYKGLGFEEISIREFAHLPFTVCFMEKAITG